MEIFEKISYWLRYTTVVFLWKPIEKGHELGFGPSTYLWQKEKIDSFFQSDPLLMVINTYEMNTKDIQKIQFYLRKKRIHLHYDFHSKIDLNKRFHSKYYGAFFDIESLLSFLQTMSWKVPEGWELVRYPHVTFASNVSVKRFPWFSKFVFQIRFVCQSEGNLIIVGIPEWKNCCSSVDQKLYRKKHEFNYINVAYQKQSNGDRAFKTFHKLLEDESIVEKRDNTLIDDQQLVRFPFQGIQFIRRCKEQDISILYERIMGQSYLIGRMLAVM